MSPEEAKRQAMDFAAGQRGWKWFEHPGTFPYAGRAFEYKGSSEEALLVLRVVDYHGVGVLRAEVHAQFTTGPVESFEGSLAECISWLTTRTTRLEVPYALQSCKTSGEAKHYIDLLSTETIWLLSIVFDIDPAKDRNRVRDRLIVMFGPKTPPALLRTFVDGHAHWSVAQDQLGQWYRPGDWYGWRVMRIFDQAYHLRIRPSSDDAHGTSGWSLVAFTDRGDELAAMLGNHAEVVAEVVAIEKTLSLVDELGTCRTPARAWQLMTSVRGERLDLVRQVCDLPRGTADKVRADIIKKVTGLISGPAVRN